MSLHFRRRQFGLRTLLGVVAGLSVVFALLSVVSLMAGLVAGWFVCLAFFHVAGNVLGTRLREQTTRELGQDAAGDRQRPPSLSVSEAPVRLQENTPPGFMMLVTSGLGAVGGGSLGGMALATWARVGVGGVAIGSISSAVVGGFAGFLAGSFLTISARALREASQEQRPGALAGQERLLNP